MRLLVARHGLTQHNVEARFTGQFDAPLNALGRAQAEALAERLAPERFNAIISSDLARARETAEFISARMDASVTFDPDLREIAMGAWEDRSMAEVRREQGDLLARVEMDPMGAVAYPDGESWSQFSDRVRRCLARTQAQHPDGYVLWVTHGGVVSALMLHALGLSYERRWQFARGNTSLFEFDYLPTRVMIVRANDTSHLERMTPEQATERFQVL